MSVLSMADTHLAALKEQIDKRTKEERYHESGCVARLFKPGTVQGGLSFGEHDVSAYKDTEMFGLTNLGIIFHQAVAT
jgi:hypothetical protein